MDLLGNNAPTWYTLSWIWSRLDRCSAIYNHRPRFIMAHEILSDYNSIILDGDTEMCVAYTSADSVIMKLTNHSLYKGGVNGAEQLAKVSALKVCSSIVPHRHNPRPWACCELLQTQMRGSTTSKCTSEFDVSIATLYSKTLIAKKWVIIQVSTSKLRCLVPG